MKLVTDKPGEYPTVWEWMNRKTRLPWSTDLRTIGTMREDGTIAAAVAYNCWSEMTCWMHVAFDNPHAMSRTIIRAAFEYPFLQCGKDVVYGMTPKHIEEGIRMNKRLGFKKILETPDSIMFEMKAEDCRWIKSLAAVEQSQGV